MKIQFVWYHDGSVLEAKRVAEYLNSASKINWRGWSWITEYPRGVAHQETLQVTQQTLRSLRKLLSQVEGLVECEVAVRVDGRNLFNYALWADFQIRRLKKK